MIGWASCCDCRYSAAHPEPQGRDGARAVVRKWTWQAALLSGKIACVFSPLSSSSCIFFSPTCKISFVSLMGIILSKRPTVMSEAEHLAFFLPSLHISSQSHLVVHRYHWPCQEVCSSLSTERNVPKASKVVHANHPLCLQGFSLKKQRNVLLSEVLTRAKISATGSLTLEVPGASISDL